jgi:hypothetical protein
MLHERRIERARLRCQAAQHGDFMAANLTGICIRQSGVGSRKDRRQVICRSPSKNGLNCAHHVGRVALCGGRQRVTRLLDVGHAVLIVTLIGGRGRRIDSSGFSSFPHP